MWKQRKEIRNEKIKDQKSDKKYKIPYRYEFNNINYKSKRYSRSIKPYVIKKKNISTLDINGRKTHKSSYGDDSR